VNVDDASVEAARAKVKKLEAALETEPIDKRVEIQYDLAEAKAELEVLQSTESVDTIGEKIAADVKDAEAKKEAMEAR
jgi:hypothetical protein